MLRRFSLSAPGSLYSLRFLYPDAGNPGGTTEPVGLDSMDRSVRDHLQRNGNSGIAFSSDAPRPSENAVPVEHQPEDGGGAP